jgi:thioredoxin-related protein
VNEAVGDRFKWVFVEKDDEADLVARYEIASYPTFVWTDAAGEELMRSVQPADAEELIGDLEIALEEMTATDE